MKALRRNWPMALVIIATVAAYANALANGFAYDDVFIVRQNPHVHTLSDLRGIWLTPYWPMFGTELGLWRPLAIFGYAVQWAIAGDAPWFFHMVNILLHAGVSVLVWALVRRLTKSTAAALLGGLLFAVHPVHTEVVANVVGQAELIAAGATLLACIVHISRPDGVSVPWGRRVLLVLLFLAGLLAKESAIVLPGLLVALDFVQRRVRPERRSFITYVRAMGMPVFLLASATVLYFAYRVDVLGSIGGVDAAPNLGFLRQEHRVLVAFRGWIEYFRLLVLPLDLSADYSPGVILPVEGWTPMVALGAAVFVGIGILAVLTPWFPRAGLPAAWLMVTALPTSNLLVPIGVIVAERLLYAPSVALSIAVAFLWERMELASVPSRSRRIAWAFAGVVLVLMAVRSFVRNPDWKSTEAVQAAIARDHPESYRSQWYNGYLAFQQRQIEIGSGYLFLAERIWPHDPELLNEIGFTLISRGQFDSAVAYLERSREITRWIPRTQIILAQAYIGSGRHHDALETIGDAIDLGAELELAYPLMAQSFEALGRLDLAVAGWNASVRSTGGGFWNYWSRLARARARAGDRAGALAAADSALARVPAGDSPVQDLLVQLRDEIRDGCYDGGGGTVVAGCEDPIGQWKLLAPLLLNPPRENATQSQNATPGRVEASPTPIGPSPSTIQEPTG